MKSEASIAPREYSRKGMTQVPNVHKIVKYMTVV